MKGFRKGGISMFIVIVTCMMVSIVIASFIRIMNRDFENASKQDLSQSAYDSAQAGVEDAKRAISVWQKACSSSDAANQEKCKKINQELDKDLTDQSCWILSEKFGIGSAKNGETLIQTSQSGSDSALNQAYTCVKLKTKTSDYLGQLNIGQSKLVPLKSTKPFNKVRISWFNEKNSGSEDINLPESEEAGMVKMLTSDWPKNRPSIIRAQFIFSDGIIRYRKDDSTYDDRLKSRTAFLYPSKNAVDIPVALQSESERHNFSEKALSKVKCSEKINSGYNGYACSALIDLDRTVSAQSETILRLNTQYSSADFRIEMIAEDGSIVEFDGVQPLVDSTGRANNQLRRVESRLEAGVSTLPIPEYAVSTDGEFCKVMIIRDKTSPSTIGCK